MPNYWGTCSFKCLLLFFFRNLADMDVFSKSDPGKESQICCKIDGTFRFWLVFHNTPLLFGATLGTAYRLLLIVNEKLSILHFSNPFYKSIVLSYLGQKTFCPTLPIICKNSLENSLFLYTESNVSYIQSWTFQRMPIPCFRGCKNQCHLQTTKCDCTICVCFLSPYC